jgi:cob(I)alamin adenosyltransferase
MPAGKDGLIHIYRGICKGKTTAADGLACRALGQGLSVLFVQFLKSSATGEVAALEQLGARVLRCQGPFGFVFQMDEDQRAACARSHDQLLREASELIAAGQPDLVILDEVLDALSLEMIREEELRGLIRNRPSGCEMVCTGHVVVEWLEQQASYISEICAHRHPYKNGVVGRRGVEY